MLIEIIGWIGSVLYILSYFLLSYKIIKKEKFYYLLNNIAASLIIIISFYKQTYQSIVINIIWLYISYLGYIDKNHIFKVFSKNIMHFISILFLTVSCLFYLLVDYFISAEIMAWFSVFAFSSSYFLYSMEKIKEKAFHFYNLIAALSLIPKMIIFENYQVMTLEILWAILALIAYLKNSSENDYLTICS